MKQKQFFRAIVAVAMMLICSLPSLAHDFEVDGIYYRILYSENVAVIYRGDAADSYTEYSGDVIIPQTVTYNDVEYTVTHITNYTFAYCINLKSVTIPDGVTFIGKQLFEGCINLTSLSIPKSVNDIGDDLFTGCDNLTSITVDSENTVYDSRDNCNAIIETATNKLISGCKNTVIPESVTEIGYCAFKGCNGLKNITLPSGLTDIGSGAFYECSKLDAITIPENVSSIGSHAFYGCEMLTIFEFPSKITTIEEYTLAECIRLVDITIPNSVTSIGEGAFYLCYNLTDIDIPDSVTYIGDGAFSNCQGLIVIDIPDSVLQINDYAFMACVSAETVNIGSSVTKIGDGAFGEAQNLKAIHIKATTPPECLYSSFYHPENIYLYVPAGYADTYAESDVWKYFKDFCVLAESISLDKSEISLNVNETATLTATVLSEYTTDKYVVWKSSNKSVATVDENGVVTAKGEGEATITASTDDGSDLSATCKVTVTAVPVESIALNRTEVSLKVAENLQLTATIYPENASNQTIEWESSDETVAIINNRGMVIPKAIGETIITVKAKDGSNVSATCKVTVIPTLITSIVLDKTEWSGVENTTYRLSAEILPEDATNQELLWTSSDETVATVSDTGYVEILKVGEATITAAATDGSGVTATCKIIGLSGVESISNDTISVKVEGDNIIVNNAPLGETIRVFAADGSLLTSTCVDCETMIIPHENCGVFILYVDRQTFKIVK